MHTTKLIIECLFNRLLSRV